MSDITIGVDTFGDIMVDEEGNKVSEAEAIRNVFDEGVIAEQAGLDVFAIGEHHRDDYAVSSPETLLAGIATRTEKIHLSSAVTVLSSDDPVRVYQRFATVDALSLADVQRSSSGAGPSRNLSRYLVIPWRIMRSCSKRNSICGPTSCRKNR